MIEWTRESRSRFGSSEYFGEIDKYGERLKKIKQIILLVVLFINNIVR